MVVLAWDTLDGKMPSRTNLLGYAIERAEFDVAGNEVERYWMRGIKRFKEQRQGTAARHPGPDCRASDPELPVGRLHRQGRHPLPVPDCPLYGTVKNPKLDDAAAVTLDVTTEIGARRRPTATMASGMTCSSIVA